MRAVRGVLAAMAVAIAVVVFQRLVTVRAFVEVPRDGVATTVGAALVVVCCGLLVWDARPGRATGPLLTTAGFATLVGCLAGLEPDGIDTIGSVALMCFPLVLGHAVLTYPEGLGRRGTVVAVVTCWLVPAVIGLGVLSLSGGWQPARLSPYIQYSLGERWMVWGEHPSIARRLAAAWAIWTAVCSVAISVVVVVRTRRATHALRSTLVPVAWATGAWALSMLGVAWATAWRVGDIGLGPMFELMVVLGTLVPAVTASVVAALIAWADVVRPRLDPARGGRIVLPGEPLPVADVLRRRLAAAVGDPSLRLALLGPDGGWITAGGKPVVLRDDAERATATLTRDGAVIAAVEFDHALRATPDAIIVATTMAGLAIDNARLAALDAAQIEEMRNSGAELLAAADRARRRLAATIAEGPAARLDELAASASAGVDGVELQRALRDVAVDVRTISHGVYPPELENAGLAAALDLAVEVPSRRYSPSIELTAYLVADGQAGARLVHDDGALVITIPGSVPEHAAVRVDALDGTIRTEAGVTTVVIPVTD